MQAISSPSARRRRRRPGGAAVAVGVRVAAPPGGPPAPQWRCTLTDYSCTRSAAPAAGAGRPGPSGRWPSGRVAVRRPGGRRARRGAGRAGPQSAERRLLAGADPELQHLRPSVHRQPARRRGCQGQRRDAASCSAPTARRATRIRSRVAALVAGLRRRSRRSAGGPATTVSSLHRVVADRSAAAEALDAFLPEARRRRGLRSSGRVRRREQAQIRRRHVAVPESVHDHARSTGGTTAAP